MLVLGIVLLMAVSCGNNEIPSDLSFLEPNENSEMLHGKVRLSSLSEMECVDLVNAEFRPVSEELSSEELLDYGSYLKEKFSHIESFGQVIVLSGYYNSAMMASDEALRIFVNQYYGLTSDCSKLEEVIEEFSFFLEREAELRESLGEEENKLAS